LSFRRKPESSYFKAFWTPVFTGVTVYLTFYEVIKLDGFVKSPSAALRFNFVVAAQLQGRFANRPLISCAPWIVGGSGRSPENGRPAGRPYKQNHPLGDFLRDH
jgi:hypothetical protein